MVKKFPQGKSNGSSADDIKNSETIGGDDQNCENCEVGVEKFGKNMKLFDELFVVI